MKNKNDFFLLQVAVSAAASSVAGGSNQVLACAFFHSMDTLYNLVTLQIIRLKMMILSFLKSIFLE